MSNIKINLSEVDINEVHPNNWNPKDSVEESRVNKERFEQIKKGIQTHGVLSPILVRKVEQGYEIIDGFHRWRAYKELGIDTIPINNLGEVTDEIARSLTLIMEKAKVDINPEKEALLIKEVSKLVGDDLDSLTALLPYTSEVIENKLQLIDFDWDQFEKEASSKEGEQYEELAITYRFTINSQEDIDICNKALGIAGDDKNEAFLNLCKNAVVEEERAGNV